jgi:cytochrome bd-type quinol oxidase subunit 2
MAWGLYPNVLPAHDDRPFGLTVNNAASGHHALTTAIVWWPVGMALAAVYFVFAYRMFFRTAAPPSIAGEGAARRARARRRSARPRDRPRRRRSRR